MAEEYIELITKHKHCVYIAPTTWIGFPSVSGSVVQIRFMDGMGNTSAWRRFVGMCLDVWKHHGYLPVEREPSRCPSITFVYDIHNRTLSDMSGQTMKQFWKLSGYTYVNQIVRGAYARCHRLLRGSEWFAKCIPLDSLGLLANELYINSIRIPHLSTFEHVHFTYDTCCIIMPFYSNFTLASRAPKNPEDIHRVCYQLTNALNMLHEQRIAHLDLKPSNVLVDDTFQVRLIDFGLAVRHISQRRLDVLRVAEQYRAPELFNTKHELEAYNPFAVDVWALGIIFWELIVGKHYSADPVSSESDLFEFVTHDMMNMNPELRPTTSQILNRLESKSYDRPPKLYITHYEYEWRATQTDALTNCWNLAEQTIGTTAERLDALLLTCELFLRYRFLDRIKDIHIHEFTQLALTITRPWLNIQVNLDRIHIMSVLKFELYNENILTLHHTFTDLDFAMWKHAYLNFGYRGVQVEGMKM